MTTREKYRRVCLALNRTFITEIVGLPRLTGAEYATKAREIRKCFSVDAHSLAYLFETAIDQSRLALELERRTARPRFMRTPGVFVWERGSGLSIRDQMLRLDRREEMFDWANIWIPVYEDTTKGDLDELWSELRKRERKKGTRPREEQLEKRVIAFLYFSEHGSTRGLTRAIGAKNRRESGRVLKQAWVDIMRSPWPGMKDAKERLSPFRASRLEIHISECSSVKQGNLCEECERLLNEQVGAKWGETVPSLPGVSPEDVERMKATKYRRNKKSAS